MDLFHVMVVLPKKGKVRTSGVESKEESNDRDF